MAKLWIGIIPSVVWYMSSYFWVPSIFPPSSPIHMPIYPTLPSPRSEPSALPPTLEDGLSYRSLQLDWGWNPVTTF